MYIGRSCHRQGGRAHAQHSGNGAGTSHRQPDDARAERRAAPVWLLKRVHRWASRARPAGRGVVAGCRPSPCRKGGAPRQGDPVAAATASAATPRTRSGAHATRRQCLALRTDVSDWCHQQTTVPVSLRQRLAALRKMSKPPAGAWGAGWQTLTMALANGSACLLTGASSSESQSPIADHAPSGHI